MEDMLEQLSQWTQSQAFFERATAAAQQHIDQQPGDTLTLELDGQLISKRWVDVWIEPSGQGLSVVDHEFPQPYYSTMVSLGVHVDDQPQEIGTCVLFCETDGATESVRVDWDACLVQTSEDG